jgi:hypothetical protein
VIDELAHLYARSELDGFIVLVDPDRVPGGPAGFIATECSWVPHLGKHMATLKIVYYAIDSRSDTEI